MSSLLECLSDCQPKVRSDLILFLNITPNELAQEMALLREAGLNIQEENDVCQLVPEMPLLNLQTVKAIDDHDVLVQLFDIQPNTNHLFLIAQFVLI